MKIIFLSRDNDKVHRYDVRLNRWYQFLTPVFVVVGLLSGAIGAGYYLGDRNGVPISFSAELKSAEQGQNERLDATGISTAQEAECQASMAAFTQRIGRLQAHIDRLDALGSKLVKMANLDEQEFNFRNAPGLGGPAEAEPKPKTADQNEIDQELENLALTLEGEEIKSNLEQVRPESNGVRKEVASLALTLEENESEVLSEITKSENIGKELDDLVRAFKDRETQLKVLQRVLVSRELQTEVSLSGRPITQGWMSSKYGMRTDPFTGKRGFHHGIDFASPAGSDVVAVAGGVVTWAGKRPGYGVLVEIDHGNQLVTRYAHNQDVRVKVGNVVNKGGVVAVVGSSGRSTGPHVHFEVLKEGKHVNPKAYINASK